MPTMSRRHNQRGRHDTNRRNRVIGASSTVGAFLTFGMIPLAPTPPAQADEFDWILDLFDPSLWLAADPTDAVAGLDLDAWFDPSAWDGLLSGADETGVQALALGAEPLAGDPGAFDMTAWVDQWIYQPIHTSMQNWITSDFGEMVNAWIN